MTASASQYKISVQISADIADAMRGVDGLQARLNQLSGSGATVQATALRQSIMPRAPADWGIDRKGMSDLAQAGIIVSRWTPEMAKAERATSTLARSVRGLGSAGTSGSESMQRVAGVALALSGSAGPAAEAVRGLASVVLMTAGHANGLRSALAGGLGMGAAAVGAGLLAKEYQKLASAIEEANSAAQRFGGGATTSAWALLRESVGNTADNWASNAMWKMNPAYWAARGVGILGAGQEPEQGPGTAGETTKMRMAQLDRFAEAKRRERTIADRLAQYYRENPQDRVTAAGYNQRWREMEIGDEASKRQEEWRNQARAREQANSATEREVRGRQMAARLTGVADPNAAALLGMGRQTWERVGQGNASEGVRRIEAALNAQKEASRRYADGIREVADLQRTASRLYVDSWRQATMERVTAIQEAADKEAQAHDRAAAKLRARASAKAQHASDAWSNVVAGLNADGTTAEDRRQRREQERMEARLERQGRYALDRMSRGEYVTSRGRELAHALRDRDRAESLDDRADSAASAGRFDRRRARAAGQWGEGLQRSWSAQDRSDAAQALAGEIKAANAATTKSQTELAEHTRLLTQLTQMWGVR